MAAPQADPVARLRQMKLNVAQLAIGGLLFGIGLPIAMITGKVVVWMTPLGLSSRTFWRRRSIRRPTRACAGWSKAPPSPSI